VAADSVTVTSPVHALAGRVLAVVRWVRLGDGRRYVDVLDPKGRALRLPVDFTDRGCPSGAVAAARVSAVGLLQLVSAIEASQAVGQKVDESASVELTDAKPEQMLSFHARSPGEISPEGSADGSAAEGKPRSDRGAGDTGSQALVRSRRR
jgi:hypothetical protein